jgi:broad specificity phosphatase PhoE
MPDHLIVIRSGPTEYDLQGRIRGTLDVPLTATGAAAAEAAAAVLAAQPPDALYVAADAAARETGRYIARACGMKARPLPRLSNLDQGLWQGMLVDEIRCKQPRLYRQWQDNPWAVAPPEGELLEEACLRVEEALELLLRRHARGRVAVVVPQPLDRVVRWIVSGVSMGDLWDCDQTGPATVELPLAAQWQPVRRPPVRV